MNLKQKQNKLKILLEFKQIQYLLFGLGIIFYIIILPFIGSLFYNILEKIDADNISGQLPTT